MARQRLHRRPIAEINVVPYIDVMLVLLVIFMITAPLLSQGVKVNLPRAEGKPLEDSAQPVVIRVDSAHRLYLEYGEESEIPLTPEILAARVQALLRLHPERPVLIEGDTAVPYGEVVAVMALLQKAGAAAVGLLTKPPAGPS
jgi:biopolymer transport protein TolR